MGLQSALACRFCGAALVHTFVDLGLTPLANSYVRESDLDKPDPRYPLHARVCERCLLVQVESVVDPEDLFSDYAYFSSYSTSWVEHARRFAELAIQRFRLNRQSQVVEVASNDGYLLRHFAGAGIPVLGIEPAANVAAVADVPTEVRFFGRETAQDLLANGFAADLLVGNNVLAHVPDLNDFVSGLAVLLKPKGILCLEFPHLYRLITDVQFDTIYHEHFCYFSFLTVEKVLAWHGLVIFDVDQLSTHGGSLRIFARHSTAMTPTVSSTVEDLRRIERDAGLDSLQAYTGFSRRVFEVKQALLEFLNRAKVEGRSVAAYGAAAKGNTLLNYCNISTDLVSFVVDRNPHKQGHSLPGSRLPICPPERVFEAKPDYLLILPWNIKEEIMATMAGIRKWGGRFVVPIPKVEVMA